MNNPSPGKTALKEEEPLKPHRRVKQQGQTGDNEQREAQNQGHMLNAFGECHSNENFIVPDDCLTSSDVLLRRARNVWTQTGFIAFVTNLSAGNRRCIALKIVTCRDRWICFQWLLISEVPFLASTLIFISARI